MVQISEADAFIFFGGIVLGALIGVVGNFVVESAFWAFKFFRNHATLIFGLAFTVFLVLTGVSLYYFQMLSNTSDKEIEKSTYTEFNPTCNCCNYSTSNYYNIYQITIEDKKPVKPLLEFKNILHNRG